VSPSLSAVFKVDALPLQASPGPLPTMLPSTAVPQASTPGCVCLRQRSSCTKNSIVRQLCNSYWAAAGAGIILAAAHLWFALPTYGGVGQSKGQVVHGVRGARTLSQQQ
jgi:hypothetical protein